MPEPDQIILSPCAYVTTEPPPTDKADKAELDAWNKAPDDFFTAEIVVRATQFKRSGPMRPDGDPSFHLVISSAGNQIPLPIEAWRSIYDALKTRYTEDA